MTTMPKSAIRELNRIADDADALGPMMNQIEQALKEARRNAKRRPDGIRQAGNSGTVWEIEYALKSFRVMAREAATLSWALRHFTNTQEGDL